MFTQLHCVISNIKLDIDIRVVIFPGNLSLSNPGIFSWISRDPGNFPGNYIIFRKLPDVWSVAVISPLKSVNTMKLNKPHIRIGISHAKQGYCLVIGVQILGGAKH